VGNAREGQEEGIEVIIRGKEGRMWRGIALGAGIDFFSKIFWGRRRELGRRGNLEKFRKIWGFF